MIYNQPLQHIGKIWEILGQLYVEDILCDLLYVHNTYPVLHLENSRPWSLTQNISKDPKGGIQPYQGQQIFCIIFTVWPDGMYVVCYGVVTYHMRHMDCE